MRARPLGTRSPLWPPLSFLQLLQQPTASPRLKRDVLSLNGCAVWSLTWVSRAKIQVSARLCLLLGAPGGITVLAAFSFPRRPGRVGCGPVLRLQALHLSLTLLSLTSFPDGSREFSAAARPLRRNGLCSECVPNSILFISPQELA